MRTSLHSDSTIEFALHEAFHSAERWTTGDGIEILRAASANGPEMPRSSDFNIYWCRPQEVRARAFAAWGYSHWLSGTTPPYRFRMPSYERLWTMIYRGDLGLRVARRGLIPANRIPEVLHQRMAQRGNLLMIFDAVRRVCTAAIAWFRPSVDPRPTAANSICMAAAKMAMDDA